MKSFVFPLEKVMAFRKRQWEAEAALLESLLANRAHLESQLQRVNSALDLARTQLSEGTVVSSPALAEFRLAQASSHEALRQLERVLASLRTKITAQQRAVVHSRRNFELVLRLREKRFAEWLREVSREEEANATESFLARHTQRRLALSSQPPLKRSAPADATPLPIEEPAGGC